MERDQAKAVHVVGVPLEDYWKEFSSFEEGGHPDEDDDDASKTPDEGEIEEEWLREAGFETLVDELTDIDQEECFEDLLATLTARQRAVVQRRLDTVQMSKRRRHLKGRQRADVRQVFFNHTSPVTAQVLIATDTDTNSVSLSAPRSLPSSFTPAPPLSGRPQPGSRGSLQDDQQQHKNRSTTSSVLPPLPFLRTGHSGGFSLREHSKAIDSESSTSVEVLKYASRISVVQDRDPSSHDNDDARGRLKMPDISAQETSFQEIASRLDPVGEFPDGLASLSSINWPQSVQASDLSPEDKTQVRTLAVIEVAALLDSHGLVPTRRRKKRKKGKDNVVFGAALTSILELDRRRCPGLKIPLIYQWVLHHLHSNGLREEGLMRLGGSVQKTQALKAEIERSYVTSPILVENVIRQSSVHEVAAILKQLVRHLPEPLLTNSHMDAFLQVPNIPNIQDQINTLNLLVLALPDVHRELLEELLYFLAKIVEEEEYNRMSLGNVAMIVAPNLFPPPRRPKKLNHHKGGNDLAAEVTIAALSSKVTQLLIKYGHCVGLVPAELLTQARLQSHRSKHKYAKRSGGKKNKAEKMKITKDALVMSTNPLVGGSVLRVQVSSLRPPSSVAVPVDGRTTAGDVVTRVAAALDTQSLSSLQVLSEQQENRAILMHRPRTTSEPIVMRPRCLMGAKKPNDCLKDHFLYHVRENVGERMLDHATGVLGVVGTRFGQGSTWEVRCHH